MDVSMNASVEVEYKKFVLSQESNGYRQRRTNMLHSIAGNDSMVHNGDKERRHRVNQPPAWVFERDEFGSHIKNVKRGLWVYKFDWKGEKRYGEIHPARSKTYGDQIPMIVWQMASEGKHDPRFYRLHPKDNALWRQEGDCACVLNTKDDAENAFETCRTCLRNALVDLDRKASLDYQTRHAINLPHAIGNLPYNVLAGTISENKSDLEEFREKWSRYIHVFDNDNVELHPLPCVEHDFNALAEEHVNNQKGNHFPLKVRLKDPEPEQGWIDVVEPDDMDYRWDRICPAEALALGDEQCPMDGPPGPAVDKYFSPPAWAKPPSSKWWYEDKPELRYATELDGSRVYKRDGSGTWWGVLIRKYMEGPHPVFVAVWKRDSFEAAALPGDQGKPWNIERKQVLKTRDDWNGIVERMVPDWITHGARVKRCPNQIVQMEVNDTGGVWTKWSFNSIRQEMTWTLVGDGRCDFADRQKNFEGEPPLGADYVSPPVGNAMYPDPIKLEACQQACKNDERCTHISWKRKAQTDEKALCYVSSSCGNLEKRANGADNFVTYRLNTEADERATQGIHEVCSDAVQADAATLAATNRTACGDMVGRRVKDDVKGTDGMIDFCESKQGQNNCRLTCGWCVIGYQKVVKSCVKGEDIPGSETRVATVKACAELCNQALDSCAAFEYGVNYGGTATTFDRNLPPRCLLKQEALQTDCNGEGENLDLYIKMPVKLYKIRADRLSYYSSDYVQGSNSGAKHPFVKIVNRNWARKGIEVQQKCYYTVRSFTPNSQFIHDEERTYDQFKKFRKALGFPKLQVEEGRNASADGFPKDDWSFSLQKGPAEEKNLDVRQGILQMWLNDILAGKKTTPVLSNEPEKAKALLVAFLNADETKLFETSPRADVVLEKDKLADVDLAVANFKIKPGPKPGTVMLLSEDGEVISPEFPKDDLEAKSFDKLLTGVYQYTDSHDAAESWNSTANARWKRDLGSWRQVNELSIDDVPKARPKWMTKNGPYRKLTRPYTTFYGDGPSLNRSDPSEAPTFLKFEQEVNVNSPDEKDCRDPRYGWVVQDNPFVIDWDSHERYPDQFPGDYFEGDKAAKFIDGYSVDHIWDERTQTWINSVRDSKQVMEKPLEETTRLGRGLTPAQDSSRWEKTDKFVGIWKDPCKRANHEVPELSRDSNAGLPPKGCNWHFFPKAVSPMEDITNRTLDIKQTMKVMTRTHEARRKQAWKQNDVAGHLMLEYLGYLKHFGNKTNSLYNRMGQDHLREHHAIAKKLYLPVKGSGYHITNLLRTEADLDHGNVYQKMVGPDENGTYTMTGVESVHHKMVGWSPMTDQFCLNSKKEDNFASLPPTDFDYMDFHGYDGNVVFRGGEQISTKDCKFRCQHAPGCNFIMSTAPANGHGWCFISSSCINPVHAPGYATFELHRDSWCPQHYPVCMNHDDRADCVIEECENGCSSWNRAPNYESAPKLGYNYVEGVGRIDGPRMCTGNWHPAVNERLRDLKTRGAVERELQNALNRSAFREAKRH